MRLVQPDIQSEPIKDSFRQAQAYTADGYYRHTFKPLDFDGDGSTTQINGLPVRQLDTAVDSTDRASMFKSQYWWNGNVRWSFRWSTDGSSTNTVNLTVTLYSYDLDDNTGNRTTLYSATFNVTPSGTANYLKSTTVTSTTAINSDADVVAVVITRNGNAGDTNPDEFFMGPSYVEYLPANRQ